MNTINKIHWDVETEALPKSEIEQFAPTEFALGNLRDPVKIEAAKIEKRQEWFEKAALSPITGRILCIGIKSNEDSFSILQGDEVDILRSFWLLWSDQKNHFIGFNVNSFDLPFIIRRSLKWNVALPMRVPRKPWEMQNSTDLMEVWAMGDRQERISLDNLAKFLGFPGKTGHGRDFAALWHTDRAKAEEYLHRDVLLVQQIAGRMGV